VTSIKTFSNKIGELTDKYEDGGPAFAGFISGSIIFSIGAFLNPEKLATFDFCIFLAEVYLVAYGISAIYLLRRDVKRFEAKIDIDRAIELAGRGYVMQNFEQ
jgi:hypothetical protein